MSDKKAKDGNEKGGKGKLMIILDVARLFSAMVEQPKAAA